MMEVFFHNVWKYLKDWKNLLGHTLLGVGIILVSAVMPLPWWGRLVVLMALVVFNIYRERLFVVIFSKKRSVSKEED